KSSPLFPLVVFLLITFIFFWPFFIKGLLPIPGDIVSGTYYPWLDLNLKAFPAGVPVKNPAFSDIVSIMYPGRELAINLMKSGEWPLWNPYILSGTSLLANFQSAALYPTNIVYWLIKDFSTAWSLQVVSQPLLASLFMYLFLREHKLSRLSSVYGSFVWAFSGFAMVWLEYNTLIHSALYFPLMLFTLKKTKDNKFYYLLLSILVALSFYAGYPQITIYILGFSFIYGLVMKILTKNNLGIFIASIILALGLAAPLLLPGFEATRLSIRQVDQVASASNIKYIPPQNIITFIAPDYFGNPSTRNYWPETGSYDNFVIFVGATSFLLFLLSFWLKRNKLIIFSWIIFSISFILAFRNPISELVGNLNIGLISSSVMSRLAIVMTFSIAVTASFSLEAIWQKKLQIKVLKKSALILVGLILIFSLATGLFLLPLKDYLPSIFLFNKNSLYALQTIRGYKISLRNLILPSAMVVSSILGVGFLILAPKRLKGFRTLVLVSLLALSFFDLYRFHQKYNSFSSKELLYPETPLTSFLKEQGDTRFDREKGPIIPPNMWMPYGLFSASGQEAIHPIRYNKFVNLLNGLGLISSNRYAEIENFNSPLCDFLGIENIAVIKWKNASPDFEGDVSQKFRGSKFKEVFEHERTIVLENLKAFQRIYPVKDFLLAESDEDFEKLLLSVDLSKTVILETFPRLDSLTTDVAVSNLVFTPLKTSAKVKSEGSSLLVISQTYFPGWKAYLDGESIPLYRANYTFMAVPVTVGEHHLEISYEPDSFKYGLKIGVISFIITVSLFLVSQSRFKRKILK
ncbi:MAG: YfhO family protein, partial [Patescibacteria group bacterium]